MRLVLVALRWMPYGCAFWCARGCARALCIARGNAPARAFVRLDVGFTVARFPVLVAYTRCYVVVWYGAQRLRFGVPVFARARVCALPVHISTLYVAIQFFLVSVSAGGSSAAGIILTFRWFLLPVTARFAVCRAAADCVDRVAVRAVPLCYSNSFGWDGD